MLLDAAEEAGCQLFFSHPLAHVDVPSGTMFFYLNDKLTGRRFQRRVKASVVFGADGGGSRCRQALVGEVGDTASDVGQPLGYGYKELQMPATPAGDYQVRSVANTLHASSRQHPAFSHTLCDVACVGDAGDWWGGCCGV